MKTATLAVLTGLVLQASAFAASLPAGARTEVEALLSRLATSGCEFNRNGSWYEAKEASAHLRKKFDYLERKEKLGSTDDFIALAGTGSSQSGKPYQVRCGSAPVQASADWLRQQLATLRKAAGK